MNQVTEKIKQHGRELGFLAVGICDAEPLEAEGKKLEAWLNRGWHGTMDWMSRTRRERSNPRSYFPGARSVVVAALNYYRENEPVQRRAGEGNISIYARGRDYHKVMRKKLKILLAYIETLLPGVRGRVCVDSFPVMEKPLAVKAGIGWIGKHTNLITKHTGSYFFLGEILLSEALPADPRFRFDHCGTCNRCQVACPTHALDEAYVLDARRCISYLTIEHEGPIAGELAADMENWVFGCDICQAVCPWNRFSTHTAERDFDNRLPDEWYQLDRLKDMTEAQFLQLFEGTPVRRAGYQNFKRNVEIALQDREKAGSEK